MKPKIVVHIGPPKTATTSLQYALKEITNPNFYYGGVLQPRNCLQYFDLGKQLYYLVVDKKQRFDEDLFLQRLRDIADKYSVVLLSEEMFLVFQQDCSVEEKLSRLCGLLSEFDLTLLYTYRNPNSAIPSLYQELYDRLPSEYVDNYSRFVESNYSVVYDIEYVKQIVNKFGTDVRCVDIFDFMNSENPT